MKRGRKPKITAALTKRVSNLLSQGLDQKSACTLVGVPYSTYNDWKAKSEEGVEPYASLFSVISRTRDRFKLRLLNLVVDGAEGKLPRHADPRCAQWLLERSWPLEFAPYDRRPIPVEPDTKTDQQRMSVGIFINPENRPAETIGVFPIRDTPAGEEQRLDAPELTHRYNRATHQIEPIDNSESLED
jgi:hypothetical protein